LLLDPDGYVAEGTGDNFFVIKDGTIYSPEGRNILRGISRDYVMKELAPQLGIPVVEKNLDPYDIYTADEAFMTGTPFCMLPVTRINGDAIGTGKVGPVFQKVLDKWSANTGVDVAGQIKAWNAEGSDAHGDAPTPYRFKAKK
jgi:branched-chain amino acid aminotransferase